MLTAVLLNIGNTFTEIAGCAGSRLLDRERHPTPSLLAPGWESPLLSGQEGVPRVAACVVPAVRQRFESSGQAAGFTWLSARLPLGLDFSAVDARTVGADRVANALAAAELLPLPAIVLDCGTAITIEVVDAGKRFLGGAILPGRRLARQALSSGTGQLPEVPLAADLPEPIGTTTREAILAGVDLGLIGGIDRLLAATAAALGGRGLPACIVGGDGAYFARYLAHAVAGPPDFTMCGLAIAARRLHYPSAPGGSP